MKIHLLLLGDIIGRPGRRIVRDYLERLRRERPVDMVIANVENAAHGFGVTPDIAQELRGYGIHVMTSGNHIYDKKEILPVLDDMPDLLRPANYPAGAPGRGWGLYSTTGGVRVAVINLQGRVLMPWVPCPFDWVDQHLEAIRRETNLIVVDMHAEATSEKTAMGWYLNGKVTVVFGTHTHIPTADARILTGGHTAYVTDVGMNGPYDSVIGMDPQMAIQKLRTMFPKHLEVAGGPCQFAGLYVVADADTGRALSVEHILLREPYGGES
jgi:metallophosphoesterase (TIGR00282 family)